MDQRPKYKNKNKLIEKIGINLHDTGFDKEYLDVTLKARTTGNKINWTIKTDTFLLRRKLSKKSDNHQNGRKYLLIILLKGTYICNIFKTLTTQ